MSRHLTKKWAHILALDSAAELIRAHLSIGGALPQSAYVPVEWPLGSREYVECRPRNRPDGWVQAHGFLEHHARVWQGGQVFEDVMDVIRVRENVRDERAKPETDHVAVSTPILDEERDLPAALEIERAPQ